MLTPGIGIEKVLVMALKCKGFHRSISSLQVDSLTALSGSQVSALMSADPVQIALELQPLVRQHADDSELQRHLAQPIAQAFAQSGLYRIAAPPPVGTAATPLQQVETI